MSSSAGLRRFVSGPPPAAQAGAAPSQRTEGLQRPPDSPADIQQAPAPGNEPEKCELCATEVPAEHGHLADLDNASLLCACRACYLLFTQREAVRGRYRAVPDRYLTDPDHPLTSADWDDLQIPVGLAFFLRSSRAGMVSGFYPSPAGATECQLDLAAWERLASEHPLLGTAEPDVEAVLITRTAEDSAVTAVESFVAPIDACYELAGRMRLHWRGFDGGAEARQAIAGFLDTVRGRTVPVDQGT
ncbi:MAG TPA: DUF5947 family protein [Streptosporangiaceae bacterium]